MSNMKLQTLKGFRDFLPVEARKRQYVINTLRSVFESYGFEPLETPTLEYEEILMGKYGEEGDKLMYRFEDNGGRRVAMRYDQTVPLARVVAQYGSASSPQGQPLLPFPFKRYQVQPVWRAENTQKGRFREFLQCDIDTVGVESQAADAEIVSVVAKSFEALGFTKYKILLNDRKIFGSIPPKAITIIDKLEKVGGEKVKQELREKGYDEAFLEKVQNSKLTDDLNLIIEIAKGMGVDANKIVFEPTLARGLDYYTGMILEVEIDGYDVGSVGGGGRYDKLVGMFLPAGRQVPAVGFAFGFDRIIEAMDEMQLFPDELQTVQVLVTIMGQEYADDAMEIASKLRANNVNTELWLDAHAKMEKQLKYADQKGIAYAVILGPEEKEKGVVTLKNLKTHEQKQTTIEELTELLSAQ